MTQMMEAMKGLHELIVGQNWFTICVLMWLVYVIHKIAAKHGIRFDFHIWRNGKDNHE